ncbi:MAG: flavodoxin domain-containing protein, partial [Planctomycetota bacterium]
MRLPEGLLAARDQCPHRGAKFGIGDVHDGHLRCPYHGWEFGADGKCAKIPSLIDPSSCPDASLDKFAVQERYGMVWVRLDEHELSPLPDIPEFEDAEWVYQLPEPMAFHCGFRREIENYLDMSHFAFAHKTTLGVAAADQITDITISHFDDGFQMDAPFPVLENPDEPPGKLQQSHHRRQRVYLPNFTTIRQSFHDGDSRVLLHVPSPIDAERCVVFWSLAISPKFDGPPAESQVEFAIRVLDEDRVMVENQRPREVPMGPEPVVLVPADRLANTYKSALAEVVERDHAEPAWRMPRGGEAEPDAEEAAGEAAWTAMDADTVTVLFASQTSNAENLAHRLTRTLRRGGTEAQVASLGELEPDALAGRVFVVTSTYGYGDPPESARPFVDALQGDDAPDLSGVRFAVFGLGDRSYPHFCQGGKTVDAALARCGAQRLLSRIDADTEYLEPFARWAQDVQRVLGKGRPQDVVALVEDDTQPGRSAARPVPAAVIENQLLSLTGSQKETRHYEIAVGAAGLTYEPGDTLGVLPTNDPDVVDALLAEAGWDGDRQLADGRRLRTTLESGVELRRPSAVLIAELAERAGLPDLAHAARTPARRGDVDTWLDGRDVLDVLRELTPNGQAPGPDDFVGWCEKLQPRLYSIASSPLAHPHHAHLTVATVRYERGRRSYRGVASTFLADRVAKGQAVPVFVRNNPSFHLPDDPSADLILIGPGTGVAPFRGFLQHRAAQNASGRTWLFFGEQRRGSDFLYQAEMESWHADGTLDRLDLAFSRDAD